MSKGKIEENNLEEFAIPNDDAVHGKAKAGPETNLLKGSVKFYEELISSLHNTFVVVFNTEGKHIEVWSNPTVSHHFKININTLKGKFIEEIYDPYSSEIIKSWISGVIESGNDIRKITTLGISGVQKKFDVVLKPLSDKTSVFGSVVGIFRILDEKPAEKVVEISDLDTLIEQHPEGYILTNKKGIITSISSALVNQSGFDPESFRNRKVSHLPVFRENDKRKIEKLIDDALAGNEPDVIEAEWNTNTGRVIWSEIVAKALYLEDKISSIQLFFKDVSTRKLIEKDLIKTRQAYKVIIENSQEAIAVLYQGRIQFSNSRAFQILESFDTDLSGRLFEQYVHSNDKSLFNEIIGRELFLSDNNDDNKIRLINPEGKLTWIRILSLSIEWEDQPAILIYFHDITNEEEAYEKQSKKLEEIKQMLNITLDFTKIDIKGDVLSFIGEKIFQVSGADAVLLAQQDETNRFSTVNSISGHETFIRDLFAILEKGQPQKNIEKLVFETFKGVSSDRLIKYNDGIFEKGSGLFKPEVFKLIRDVIGVGDIYLLGIRDNRMVYATAILFFKSGKTINYQQIIENIGKLGGLVLSRKNDFDVLDNSLNKYKSVFESYPDLYFQTDREGIIQEISPSVQQITGFLQEEVSGKFIHDFSSEKSSITNFLKTLLINENVTDFDIKLKRKNGSIIDTSLNARVIKTSEGQVSGFEGFLRDISQRKKIEEKFQRSEEKFRTLADFTFDWEYWISGDGQILYMSPSCERITGYTPDEFIENPRLLSKIIHENDYEIYVDQFRFDAEAKDEGISEVKFRIITKNNNIRWISQKSRQVFNNLGQSLGKRVSNSDITKQVVAEQELKNSEKRFKALFVDSPDPVVVKDHSGIILDINPTGILMLGGNEENLIGTSFFDHCFEGDRNALIEEYEKIKNSGSTRIRFSIQTVAGDLVPVGAHASVINYSGQQAIIFILRDISEIVQKENTLIDSVRKAEEADMLKSAFLANVSHEIRTPMNAIIGFSEILTNPDLSQEEREEFINYITQGGNTLMNLIEDIIDITKIEAGQMKVDFSDCNINNLLDELYATFLKMKNKNGKTEVELRMNKPSVEETFSIKTDPNRIRQILSNLLGNAIKFTHEGSIEFGFNLRGSNQIIFYVKDTGQGIPEDKVDLIFERFGQVKENNEENIKGTGLGLSISKKLAELLGGTLAVKSAEGKGSTFFLTLPIQEVAGNDEKQSLKQTPEIPYWSDHTFLIAEDSILNYTFLEALFQKTKVNLVWAKNGKDAVDICRKNDDISLVLMDIKMPIMSGLDAISEIKAFKPELPIIVQTAFAMSEDRERSIAAGADEHLTKPINPDELFSTIKKVL